ncbi:MAG: aminomethyl-transferring glycine dehydrogenase subunit GcvPA [Clostridiales bacterium]|jgi:glycine dehydrogenase subunit 1|nr:aminomethyl-transferring glycine dehydrogenase subunit GcvPA [Clostridiales bacterium]
MHRYNGNTQAEQQEMLQALGLNDVGQLFADIPAGLRLGQPLSLPPALAEQDLIKYLAGLAGANANTDEYTCFLGAGAYDRHIPAHIHHLISRQEFLTAYTPYQPEISQGTLQNIFEYQSMICELTGMDVANASMYDGASALAEAAISACNATRRSRILVSAALHPEYRQTIQTYCRFNGVEIEEFPYQNGQADLKRLEEIIGDNTAAILLGQPNFFGIVEDISAAAQLAHTAKALLLVSADPIALALLEAPGNQGADIVVGEGQSLGNPLGFGGPYLGFFAAKEKHLRRMPGRITGITKDVEGKRGFVLTIQTREQHIRREKATSNICSNEALCALAAAIYMSTMGQEGLREVARLSLAKAHYAHDALLATGKFKPLFPDAPYFQEFALTADEPIYQLNKRLLKEKIFGGYDLSQAYPTLGNSWLVACTEKRTKEEIDILAKKAGADNA